MDNRNRKINQIFSHLAKAATVAADSVTGAVQAAGHAVGEKYDVFKLKVELSRLQDEQTKLFADIGRLVFLMHSGEFTASDADVANEVIDAQQTVDSMLLLADERQEDIDFIEETLSALSGEKVCMVCGRAADSQDQYCAGCGEKFLQDE